MQALIAFLVLIVMIILHEWGHFIAGRICGIPIYEFSIGMGPAIFKHKSKKNTIFSLRLFPIGGYCAFDNLEEMSGMESGLQDVALDKLSIPKRLFICGAGPFMNIFTGFIIALCLCTFAGKAEPSNTITGFTDGMPAQEYLMENDKIIKINGVAVDGNNLTYYIDQTEGKMTEFTVLRNGQEVNVNFAPVYYESTDTCAIGIYRQVNYSSIPVQDAIPNAFKQTKMYFDNIVDSFIGLLNGKYKTTDMSGIIGVVDIMGDYATTSTLFPFLNLVAFISVNLGVMNLLPIPGLDGSKILFAFVEAVTRKKVEGKWLDRITVLCFLALIVFSIYIAASDIIKILN